VSSHPQLFTQYDVPGGRKVFALPFKSLLDVLQVSPVFRACAHATSSAPLLFAWSCSAFQTGTLAALRR